jgi:hypothetical protein
MRNDACDAKFQNRTIDLIQEILYPMSKTDRASNELGGIEYTTAGPVSRGEFVEQTYQV